MAKRKTFPGGYTEDPALSRRASAWARVQVHVVENSKGDLYMFYKGKNRGNLYGRHEFDRNRPDIVNHFRRHRQSCFDYQGEMLTHLKRHREFLEKKEQRESDEYWEEQFEKWDTNSKGQHSVS